MDPAGIQTAAIQFVDCECNLADVADMMEGEFKRYIERMEILTVVIG